MTDAPVVLDSDTLSELSRGNPAVVARARSYLEHHGRLTTTAITVFERLRGYHEALAAGRPYEPQLRQFEAFTAACVVLPLDDRAAERAARIWGALDRKGRRALGDILIAAVASVHGLPLATRNRRDFRRMAELPFVNLTLIDWTR
jgi:predicted nucleic acid-binding protein